jgi:phage FluMu gp28-like protein
MPTIQAAARLARERVSDRTYRQEWLAEFVADGSFFVGVRECVRPVPNWDRQHTYTIGADWARSSSGDATVFIVYDATARQVVFVVRLVGMAYDRQLQILAQTWREYGRPSILAEQNSMGGPLVESLQTAGLPVLGFTTTAATKHEIVTALQLAIERHEIGLMDHPVLLAELEAFEVKARAGLPAYGAPDGMHDDTVIALALALRAARGSGLGLGLA